MSALLLYSQQPYKTTHFHRHAGKTLEEREAGSDYVEASMQETRPEFVQQQGIQENIQESRERSRSPLESLVQVEKREFAERREEQDQHHHLHKVEQQHQVEEQQARETEILKERLKADRSSPNGLPINLPASLTITTKSAKPELDASPASPPTSCPSPSQSPQFPLHTGLHLLPGLAGQGAPDGPVMAAALQQVMSLQQQGSGQMPSSAALLQQAQALAQLASLAQLQSMFLLQQPAMQQQQQQPHEVSRYHVLREEIALFTVSHCKYTPALPCH